MNFFTRTYTQSIHLILLIKATIKKGDSNGGIIIESNLWIQLSSVILELFYFVFSSSRLADTDQLIISLPAQYLVAVRRFYYFSVFQPQNIFSFLFSSIFNIAQ